MTIHRPAIAGSLVVALLLGSIQAWGEQKPAPTNPGQSTGTPTSTPTHTVPAAPAPGNITIKTKSSPAVAPQNPGQIEERSANPGQPSGTPTSTPAAPSVGLQPTKDIKPDGVIQTGGNPGNPWDPQGKCYVGLPPKHYRCPQGQVMVDLDPSPKVCWRCVVPME